MNVINGGLFPRQMLEYIHEVHPYVHVVHGICGDRDKFFEGKWQPYGQYQERKYHIVIEELLRLGERDVMFCKYLYRMEEN